MMSNINTLFWIPIRFQRYQNPGQVPDTGTNQGSTRTVRFLQIRVYLDNTENILKNTLVLFHRYLQHL